MNHTTKQRAFIRLNTELPGPKSRAYLKERQKHVPRGPYNTSPVFIKKAEGARVTDVDDNQLLDFAGGIGTLNVGHCPPKVVAALKEQVDNFLHSSFHVCMYESYVKLAAKLNELTPGDHTKKTFFLNSGAEAVENAVKIARKYTGRKAIISFERGFHGRTMMSMSLTSKVKPYKYGFGPFVPETYKTEYPYYYRNSYRLSSQQMDEELLRQLEELFLKEVPPDEVAAIIMEPVQGEGGFIVPSKRFVQGVYDICHKHKILFIADEVQTGFGRTGKMFASEHFGIVPDLMVMSKSIGAGLPISAVTGRADIMEAPEIGEIGGTYGGSPLGCVAALEVIDILEKQHLVERANRIGEKIMERFSQWKTRYEPVGDIRGLGAMCAMELVIDKKSKQPDKELAGRIIQACNHRGLIVMGAGLYGNVVRLLCPLVITDEELNEGLGVLEEVLADVVSQ